MFLEVTFLKITDFVYTDDSGKATTFYHIHVLIDGVDYYKLSIAPEAVSDFDGVEAGEIIKLAIGLTAKGKVKVLGIKL